MATDYNFEKIIKVQGMLEPIPPLLNRRAFLLLSLLQLTGCTTRPKTVTRITTQPLPPQYSLIIKSEPGFKLIGGQAIRIDRTKRITTRETYVDKYSADSSGFADTGKKLLKDPGTTLPLILVWPLAVLAAGSVGVLTALDPDRSKYVKKESTVTNVEIVGEESSQNLFDDRERAINIIISSSNQFKELFVVNTNNQGIFIFNFEKFVIDNKLPPVDSKLDFFHNMLNNPESILIPASAIDSIRKAHFKEIKRKAKAQTTTVSFALNRTDYFQLIHHAFGIKHSVKLAIEIYKVYRIHGRKVGILFLFRGVFPHAIIAFAVEEAFFILLRWLLIHYKSDLINLFGDEVRRFLPT